MAAKIHPAIGIARVGDSPDEFFIGPEAPGVAPQPGESFKDAQGRIKRQAARFRVYGYDAQGNVVKELTLDDAEIKWRVHVANEKSAWYQFEYALDLSFAKPAAQRNSNLRGADRAKLKINPGDRSISGTNRRGRAYRFDSGRFFDEKVYLGELRTDAQGRLIFLGGSGHACSAYITNRPATFANNDGWHDDTCDGPVFATVKLRDTGESIPVTPAWIVSAPPDYAPTIPGIVTAYDLIMDASFAYFTGAPPPVSFMRDIYPILRRFSDLQWVNYGYRVMYGWKAPWDFTDPTRLAKLGSNGPKTKEMRVQIFNAFRNPDGPGMSPLEWPCNYGDGANWPDPNPHQYLSVTRIQYWKLHQWALGNFIADWSGMIPAPPPLEAIPVEAQPAALDRAALENCDGGPFHPGCELPWIMRVIDDDISLYDDLFRIRVRHVDRNPEPDLGPVLTPEQALAPGGPLAATGPGGLTRWMAVPWQTDTAGCRSGYDPQYDEFLPSFWPSRVPNQVLTEEQYRQVMNKTAAAPTRELAFETRASWLRGLNGIGLEQMIQMVHNFGKLGIVVPRPGPKDVDMPDTFLVETGVSVPLTDDAPDPEPPGIPPPKLSRRNPTRPPKLRDLRAPGER